VRGVLRPALLPFRQGHQVDDAVPVPVDVEFRGIQGDLREVEFRQERFDGRHDHVEALEPRHGGLFSVLQCEVPQHHVAGDDHGGILLRRHGEGDRRLHVELPGGDGDVQLVRHIGQVEGQIQVFDEDVEDGLVGILEYLGLAFQGIGIPVDDGRKPGLDVGVDVLGRVGDEGDADVHAPYGVGRVEGAVDEIDAPLFDDDVVDREKERFFLLVLRLLLLQLKQIGEVVRLVPVSDQVHVGFPEDEFLDDGRALEQGPHVEVDDKLVEGQEGRIAPRFLDLESPQRGGQRVGVEAEVREAHRAADRLRHRFQQVRLHDGRNDEKADDREEDQGDGGPDDPFPESCHDALRWRGVAVFVKGTAGSGNDNPTAIISHSPGGFSIAKKAERAGGKAARDPCGVMGRCPASRAKREKRRRRSARRPRKTHCRRATKKARNTGRKEVRVHGQRGAPAQKMLEMRGKNS